MASLNNITYASPNNSFYALAGQSASNWYNFSSLTGKVFLTDDTGNHVIQAIGNDLFYDNELLAKANDIQEIADWSLYPALSTIIMNGQIITECSSIQVKTITSDNISTGVLAVTGGIDTGASGIITNAITTIGLPLTTGDVKTNTVTATGLVSANSVSATSTISGGSLTTTGGIDMTNTALLRTSNIALSAFGAPPYGNLTSPDGSSLTWNGAVVTTGAAGSASQWANYPAVSNVNVNGNTISNATNITASSNVIAGNTVITPALFSLVGSNLVVQSGANLELKSPVGGIDLASSNDIAFQTSAGNITNTSYLALSNTVGTNFTVLADRGINPVGSPVINLTAQNGNGGVVNVTANPGSIAAFGGKVNITANGGTIYVPRPPPDPPVAVTVGGEVNITANTGGGGLYTLTSAINLVAAGVNSYAGAIPPIGSLAGYQFIYGTGGVSLCAGLPATGVQFPGTTYIYGIGIPGIAGGVRLQSPQGIQMLSDTYIENLYPLDGNGLTIQGRSLPSASVTIKDLQQLTMNAATALQTDRITSVKNLGVLFQDAIQATKIQPLVPSSPGASNLLISGNNNFLGTSNYVGIRNLSTLAFDAATSGAITGLQSINGAAWPPPTGDASLWSQYPATSVVNISSFGLKNVSSITGLSSINGQAYPIASQDWSQYPALQNVNMNTFGFTNVASMNVLNNFTLTSISSIGIFTDNGGDLSIASSGGGNINIGTANAGDINIATGGTGNEVTIAGDVINLDATVGIRISNTLDMIGQNIINVANLNGSNATNLNIASTAEVVIQGATNAQLECSTGSVNMVGQQDANMVATTGAVNITGFTEISLQGAVTVGSVIAPKDITVNGLVSATKDVVAFSGTTNYSLSTIGALVNSNQRYNYWVAVNGNDTTGNGSVIKPFATITGALAATISISDTIPININIAAGTFTENPTITRNNTFLVGNVGVADAVIIGTVTFDPTATATVSQGMSGISVVGNLVCNDALTFDINWYIQFCNITSYTNAAINAFSTGAGNNSLILNNTVVTQNITANAAIVLNSVRLNAIQVQINNTTTGACVSCNGTGSMSLYGCTLTSAGAASSSALVTYINAVSNGSASSFSLNTFTYTAATAGSGKAAFFFNNAGALAGATTINNNVFALPGAAALIQRVGIGSIAIAFGANTTSIQTIPAAGSGLTYTYTASTPLRANALFDSASSAGTANQVLGCSSAGGSLLWRSLTNQSLGSIPAATNAAVYQNQPLFYNTATQSINYIAAGDDVIIQPLPASANPVASQRGITYIGTSAAGGANFQFANGGGLTANDAGWYIYIKNGNPNGGGDITLTGALVSGNTVIHQGTVLQNGGITILTWNGTAFVAY